MENFDLNTPDWLEEIETNTKSIKYSKSPALEILHAVKSHETIYKEYFFHHAVVHQDLKLSEKGLALATSIHSRKLTLSEFLVETLGVGIEISAIVNELSWQMFEEFVEAIFIRYGWQTTRNFRFKSVYSRRSNLEVDIIAWQPNSRTVLLIDCKRYKIPSPGMVKKAVIDQTERVYQFQERLPDIYGKEGLAWALREDLQQIYPVLITWRDHQVEMVENQEKQTPVISVIKLQDFLERLSEYLDNAFHVSWSVI